MRSAINRLLTAAAVAALHSMAWGDDGCSLPMLGENSDEYAFVLTSASARRGEIVAVDVILDATVIRDERLYSIAALVCFPDEALALVAEPEFSADADRIASSKFAFETGGPGKPTNTAGDKGLLLGLLV